MTCAAVATLIHPSAISARLSPSEHTAPCYATQACHDGRERNARNCETTCDTACRSEAA
jgi:hypothetical protein